MQCLEGSPGHCTSQHRPAPALHMLSFENNVKSMPPSLSELKVTPSFCFAFKIPDDVTASNIYGAHICNENWRDNTLLFGLHGYIVDAVGSSRILIGKQKLGLTFNSDKLGGTDFTKFSKLTMCSAGAGRCWLVQGAAVISRILLTSRFWENHC